MNDTEQAVEAASPAINILPMPAMIAIAVLVLIAVYFFGWWAARRNSAPDRSAEITSIRSERNKLTAEVATLQGKLDASIRREQSAADVGNEYKTQLDFQTAEVEKLSNLLREYDERDDEENEDPDEKTYKRVLKGWGQWTRLKPYLKARGIKSKVNEAISAYNKDAAEHIQALKDERKPKKWAGQSTPVSKITPL